MWSRENIPLLVMSVVSAAILCVFALSVSAMFSAPRQLGGCGWSEQGATAPIWPRAGNSLQDSWNPTFPPSRVYQDAMPGWEFFEAHRAVPPAQISKASTPEELEIYFRGSGFETIEQHRSNLGVIR